MADRRLKAVWDVRVPVIRELAGVHTYDGVVMDLSPSGFQAALKRLGSASPGERLADRHDESHLLAAERAVHAEAEAGMLRWNPLPHIQNLDLSCYDREYAPEPQRHRAREAHLALWPEAVDASLESLQAVPAPVAGALVPSVRGLAEGINGTTGAEVAALRAHGRLLARIQDAAASGNPDGSLGARVLARLLGHAESMPIDLRLATTSAPPTSPGTRRPSTSGWPSSAPPWGPPSRSTRSRPVTSPTAGCSAGSPGVT